MVVEVFLDVDFKFVEKTFWELLLISNLVLDLILDSNFSWNFDSVFELDSNLILVKFLNMNFQVFFSVFFAFSASFLYRMPEKFLLNLQRIDDVLFSFGDPFCVRVLRMAWVQCVPEALVESLANESLYPKFSRRECEN